MAHAGAEQLLPRDDNRAHTGEGHGGDADGLGGFWIGGELGCEHSCERDHGDEEQVQARAHGEATMGMGTRTR